MDVKEYIAVRRAYNLVRQESSTSGRLTFAEFAILCHLYVAGGQLRTSDIVSYQKTLRPTMTHRSQHLSEAGFVEREKSTIDRRSVICHLTTDGQKYVEDTCKDVCQQLMAGDTLNRTTNRRVLNYVDAMGELPLLASGLVILGVGTQGDEGASIGALVKMLGLLQPTVSMSVSTLTREGYTERSGKTEGRTSRIQRVLLTGKGREEYGRLIDAISEITVHRQPRSRQQQA